MSDHLNDEFIDPPGGEKKPRIERIIYSLRHEATHAPGITPELCQIIGWVADGLEELEHQKVDRPDAFMVNPDGSLSKVVWQSEKAGRVILDKPTRPTGHVWQDGQEPIEDHDP